MGKRMLRCCTLVLGLAIAARLDAQATGEPLRIGVIGGLNLAKFGGEDTADNLENRVGLLGGLSLTKARPGALGFEIDGLYSMKGAKSSGAASEATFKLDYLEVPLLLRYDFPVAGTIRPHLAVGPSVALRVGCSAEGRSGGVTVSLDCDDAGDESFGSDLRTFDAGIVVGGGVDFTAGRNTLTLGARYSYGLLSISGGDDINTKNRVISLFAGFAIPLSR
jgi:hypothetical protein